MSVQNQINRINSEVITQATLIAQALSALEGKQEGGGDSPSAQVCDVTVINETSYSLLLKMISNVENVIYGFSPRQEKTATVTYSCAMGSILELAVEAASVPNFSISYSDGVEAIDSITGHNAFKLPSAKTTATITLTSSGGNEPV